MWRWNEIAASEFIPGRRSGADDVLAELWKMRTLKRAQLRWLRSEIPVDPVSGKDVEGEEEEEEEGEE